MELRDIQKCLDQEGFSTSFQVANPEQPLDQLFVLLELEERDVQLALELVYVPDVEEEFENVKLLQFFVMLPFEIQEADAAQVRKSILQLNLNLPLMAFGFHEVDEYLYFRHVLMLPIATGESDKDVIVQTTWLVYYLITKFYPAIEEIVAG